jgi:UDP-GlcNAc3NAcA epimerase
VGARPQFVKLAAVSRVLRAIPEAHEIVVHTGQHYDDEMSDVFFREMEIAPPDHPLAVGSGGHGAQTGRMLEAVEALLLEERPDWVMVYGDTNSTLAGALAAAKLHIPVAHVEAGLRSFDPRMPEEINRVLTDHVSRLLLAPTEASVRNLHGEGIREGVHLVGDVMYDAALYYGARAEERSTILEELGLKAGGYVLATVHRAANTDDPTILASIARALAGLAAELPVVLPLHPRTRGALERLGSLAELLPGVRVIPPAGYLDMTRLEQGARLVATDSGGVQKEAFFQGVPCVTLRDRTEWVELVESGWNRLADPADGDRLHAVLREALEAPLPAPRPELYGGGHAARRVAELIVGVPVPHPLHAARL